MLFVGSVVVVDLIIFRRLLLLLIITLMRLRILLVSASCLLCESRRFCFDALATWLCELSFRRVWLC